LNFRANVDINLSKNTILNINMANIYEKRRRPAKGMGEIWSYTFTTSPNATPLRYSDGKVAHISAGSNPYTVMNHCGYANDYWNSAQSVIGLTHDFESLIPGLKANIKFSWDAYNSGTITRTETPSLYKATGEDAAGNITYDLLSEGKDQLDYSRSLDGRRTNYLEMSLVYSHLFNEKHRIGGLILFNQKQLNYLNAASDVLSLPYRSQGIAARGTYSLFDRYFAEFNMGYNGSENFSKGNRMGFFPAFALGWMLSEELFWVSLKNIIDNFKIRGSYGIVGNDQIGGGRRFIYTETVATNTPNNSSYYFGDAKYNPGIIRMGEWANPDVSWEKSYKLNIGAEFLLFKSLKMDVDYFQDRRKGIFLERQTISDMAGLSKAPWVNIGEMENRGIDVSLQYDKKIGDFLVSGMGNFTFARNKVIENDQPDYNVPYRDARGHPVNQRFGWIAEKLFDTREEIENSPPQFGTVLEVGDIKYKDLNGDGKIDDDDQTAIGFTALPEILYAFGGSVKWKGIDFSLFFQGVTRTSINLQGSTLYGFAESSLVQDALYLDVYEKRWSEANPDTYALYPKVHATPNPNNNRLSTLRLRDGSFLRLKNVEIGYTLPQKFSDKLGIASFRIYASGVNIFTFSKFKLWDPELGGGQGAGYPPNRVFTLGLNVRF
jgi:TonB-linked SusC/RagA family outer membrane protein